MRRNEGSALITVLIVMAFVIIAVTSLISTTQSEFIMAKSGNDYNAAYYIAEAGIERSLDILKNANPISAVLDYADEPTGESIDQLISRYFSEPNTKHMYPYLTASASNDRSYFESIYGGIEGCFYEVSFDTSTPYEMADKDFTKVIYITSKGHYGKSTRTIRSEYIIDGQFSGTGGESGGSVEYHDLEHFYKRNVLNIVDDDENCIFNGMELNIKGNTLFSCNSILFNTNVNTNSTENIAMITNSLTRTKNFNLGDKNVFIDKRNGSSLIVPQLSSTPILFISDNVSAPYFSVSSRLHSITEIQGDIGKKKNKVYNGGWPLISDPDYSVLTSDYSHFRDFEFKPLPDNINFDDPIFSDDTPPGQFRKIGIYYYNGPNNTINSIYLNDQYGNPGSNINGDKNLNLDFDVLVSKGDLNIDLGDPYYNKTFSFQGIIYCDGIINITNCNFTINGIIIARGINCSGKFNANYQSSTGHKLEYRMDLIEDIFNSYSESQFNCDDISCTAWDMR